MYVLLFLLHSDFLFSKQITPEYFEECKETKNQIDPKLISSKPPIYPKAALRLGIEASVLVGFTIDES